MKDKILESEKTAREHLVEMFCERLRHGMARMANSGNNEDRDLILYRVRTISCDGGRQGKTWSEKFFFSLREAEDYQKKLLRESDERNPKYPFKKEVENIDGIYGYCNWQFGTMIAVDKIFVKNIQETS